MAEASGWLWLRQAISDLEAAERVFQPLSANTYCQAISKYQQTVEKSVKALVATLRDARMTSISIGFKHDVETQVSMLLKLPRPRDRRAIQNIISSLFNQAMRGDIKALGLLAPKRPDAGQLFQRNTEYPFQDNNGAWHVPVEENAFDLAEVERFQRLAHRVYDGVSRIMSAIERAHPSP